MAGEAASGFTGRHRADSATVAIGPLGTKKDLTRNQTPISHADYAR
jgi:hypothetical protein